MFDINLWEMMLLAVVALFVFGPDRLPSVAAQAGRALRDLRNLASGARKEISDAVGPDLDGMSLSDLDPRSFARKNLFDDLTDDPDPASPSRRRQPDSTRQAPYDADAT